MLAIGCIVLNNHSAHEINDAYFSCLPSRLVHPNHRHHYGYQDFGTKLQQYSLRHYRMIDIWHILQEPLQQSIKDSNIVLLLRNHRSRKALSIDHYTGNNQQIKMLASHKHRQQLVPRVHFHEGANVSMRSIGQSVREWDQ